MKVEFEVRHHGDVSELVMLVDGSPLVLATKPVVWRGTPSVFDAEAQRILSLIGSGLDELNKPPEKLR